MTSIETTTPDMAGDLHDIRRYAAFSAGGRGGNPAGVMIADHLPAADKMQRIAAHVGYSETCPKPVPGRRKTAPTTFKAAPCRPALGNHCNNHDRTS